MIRHKASVVGKRKEKKGKTPDFGVYLITDRKLFAHNASFIGAVRKALQGGVRAVQLREKDLGTRDLLTLARKMRTITGKYGAKLFINDRFDIAIAAGADGVHLAQSSIPVHVVRKVTRGKLFVGVSTHSLKQAREAQQGGADFLTLGPVYRTPSKMKYGQPVGVDTLRMVTRRVKIPVFAVGGISSSRVREVKEAGAFGVAMIREIFRAKNITKKTRELIKLSEV